MEIDERLDDKAIIRRIVGHRIERITGGPLLLRRLELFNDPDCSIRVRPSEFSKCARQLDVAAPHPMRWMIPIRVVRNLAEDLEDVAIFGLGHRCGFHRRTYPAAFGLTYRAVEAVTQCALFGCYQFAVLRGQPFYAYGLKKILFGCSNYISE